jgi:tetratricopeptide (TPR) repeat protein
MQGRAFVQLAALAEHSGDRADARRALDDATRIAEGHGDRKLRAECLHWLGRLEAGDGELDAAEAHQRESLRLLRDMGDRKGIATCEWALGLIARGRGNTAEAQRAFEDALRLGREVGDPLMKASALCELGDLALDAGDHAAARDLLDESLALRREAGAALGVADTLVTLGRLAAATGDRDVARERFDEAASLAKVAGSRKVLAAAQAELGKLDIRGTPQDGAVFRREGEYWTVSFRDTTLRLKDSRGLRYLALLLAHPGREFHVLDVHALVEGVVATTDDAARVELKAGVRSGGEILDAQARRAYLARLEEVRAEVEEAEAWGDLERGARSREELDALLRQLAGGVGLGGRERKEVSDADRARWAVGKAIRRSLDRIAEDHPALGDHLRASIKTGAFCSYDPDAPVAWSL